MFNYQRPHWLALASAGATTALASLGAASAAQAGTYLCVPQTAGLPVLSGGTSGTCLGGNTTVQMPSSAADQQTLHSL